MCTATRLRRRSLGFSIVEALVALLVLSFGMLAIAGFQVTLSRNSDLAKQRTEATRLAQQKMESLRAYGQVATDASTPHIVNYTDDVVSGPPNGSPDITTTNAAFTRTWTVTPNATNTEKAINVLVTWSDRTGESQRVQMLSVISKFDPQDIGTLATGPGGSNVRKPKNRNLNIPYPAVTLSGRTSSAFVPPPGTVVYVFDNSSGNITKSCESTSIGVTLAATGSLVTATASSAVPYVVGNQVTISGSSNASLNGTYTVLSVTAAVFTYSLATPLGTPVSAVSATAKAVLNELTEGLNLSSSGLTCTTDFSTPKYLLSGYVRFDTGNNPSATIPGNYGASNNTKALSTSSPLALATTYSPPPNSGVTPSMVCYAQRQMVLSASSSTLVPISSATVSSTLVTVTAAAHGFSSGQTVAINNTSNTALIGAYKITQTSASTFTYQLAAPASGSSTGGTAQLQPRITVADGATATGYGSSPVEKFVSYACVVTPVDHDSNGGTPNRWWGQVTLTTDGSWSVGSTSSTFKVCRYSADYNSSASISNGEHPLWYRGVTGALDSQNYLVIAGDQNCPTDKPADLFGNPVNYADDTTADHQPTGALSFQCGISNCNGGKVVLEPVETDTTALSMD